MTELQSMREAFGRALVELGHRNPNVVVLDADLSLATKCDGFAAAFPDRFFQVGVAEQNMAGVGAGLATVGFIPFLSTFACFTSCRIADQVRTSIAQPRLNVKLVGAYSGLLTGQTGKTHQAIEDIALYRAMPNMTIVAPADGPEAAQAVHAVADFPGPVYLRLTRDPAPVVFDQNHRFEIGPAYRLREGDALTLISTGSMTPTALQAAETLSDRGVEATVLHVPTIKPLDVQAVIDAVRHTRRALTLEEHNIYGGLGGAVAEALAEHYPVPVYRIGVRDTFAESGHNQALLAKYGLTVSDVVRRALKWVRQWPYA